ncbi:serine hydrolase domain-containing protein [Ilumatobacter coccineus]|uniref:Putative esterase n=1 Tax=Ilumatobacter coccineus (strain NBRC 103263 / KCTC 29153 / YM16-304) TaxID=1313172 RepID=A0A6C7EA53_ILUCY|nr:serine hydrolase domain-containing protein [Ilumatobacter coccineus]BAN03607.1 putative esterase [Ilumatobacter coccineus YM16-304]
MTEIHGTVAPGFEAVRDAFAANWETGGEVGASVSATVGGETVVDLWGGTATYDDGERDWERDTIVNVWSTTKTMSFLCCLLLADRGELDLYAPVADYWPEFAAGGKEHVATRHIMGHTAGLSGWDEPLEVADLLDHDKLVTLHAAQAPWWEPGSGSGYHAISQGYLLGEIVKRIDGRSLGQFFADEIAGPLDADFHIGTPPEADERIAHVIPPAFGLGQDPSVEMPDETSIAWRTLSNPMMDASYSSTIDWRRAEVPAAGGHGNARSVAAIHTLTANGGMANGKQIISPEGLERIFDVQAEGFDKVLLGTELKLGMGFGLPSPMLPLPPESKVCFWGGWGGSLAIIDMDQKMSFSYVMNRMEASLTGDARGAGVLMAMYGALFAGG